MVELVGLNDLAHALAVECGELISLVGGGGKTTTLFTLGEQLAGTTVLTTTTKMGSEQTHDTRLLVDPADDELAGALHESQRVLVWKTADERRATGVRGETCDRWFNLADNVVVEADGSRKRPFKAPADHEPIVPRRTSLLVACIGASALGRSIDQSCHRPELVAALVGCEVGDPLTPARAAMVLRSEHGSKKALPHSARFVVALHRVQVDQLDLVDQLATELGDDVPLVAVKDSGSATRSLIYD